MHEGWSLVREQRMRYRLTFGFISVCTAAAAMAQTFPTMTIDSTVPTGVKRQLGFFTSLNPDCSTTGSVQSRLIKRPENGAVELEEGYGYPNYANTNQRYACNREMVMGVRVIYVSKDGYLGKDAFEAEFFTPSGGDVVWSYSVTVK